MNNRLRKILLVILAAAGIVGTILSCIMVVMAIGFGEYGRFILYTTTAIICMEMTILSILKIRGKDDT